MRRLRCLLRGLAAIVVSGLAIASFVALLVRGRLTRVEVAGQSMAPALLPGDFLLLRRGPPPPDRAYGLIVATVDPRPEGESRLLLKRIVGLPGESLRVVGGVLVNTRRLVEPYAQGDAPIVDDHGLQRLAEDAYFVLGDNRAASIDSRDFGPVPRARLEGVVVGRYWPPSRIAWLHAPPRHLESSVVAPSAAPSTPDPPCSRPMPLVLSAPTEQRDIG